MILSNKLVTLSANPLDDEYLSHVFLEFAKQEYFTVAFSEYEKDQTIYIEYCTQSQSTYSNDIDYILLKDTLVFVFNDAIAKALKYDNNAIVISLDLNSDEYTLLDKSLQAIFNGK